jgi:hypothetical protein
LPACPFDLKIPDQSRYSPKQLSKSRGARSGYVWVFSVRPCRKQAVAAKPRWRRRRRRCADIPPTPMATCGAAQIPSGLMARARAAAARRWQALRLAACPWRPSCPNSCPRSGAT